MQNESSILSALQQAVTAAVAASDDPNLPIKYLLLGNQGDGEWVVPIDQKYLELVWVPNNADDFWGDELNQRYIRAGRTARFDHLVLPQGKDVAVRPSIG